jgi:alpha-galactosidase
MYIPDSGEMTVFIAAFIGALIGFLWYNSYPASVFMGDTGSLTIGGIIAVLAISVRKEMLIPLLCGIFLAENFSVVLQVAYFKYTKKRFGEGRRIIAKALADNGSCTVEQIVDFDLYENFKDVVFITVHFVNKGNQALPLENLHINQSIFTNNNKANSIFSFHGSCYQWGDQYICPVDSGFYRENWMGLQVNGKRNSMVGGGLPIVDIWTPEGGFAIGHIAATPRLVSFPVRAVSGNKVAMLMEQKISIELQPNDSISSIPSVSIVHRKDYFDPLKNFSDIMALQGIKMKKPSEESYEVAWCGWGYESDFTLQDIYNTLPILKRLGIKWVVVDDRWFDAYGDWNVRTETIPGGEAQLKQFVDSLHAMGFLIQIWWAPPAVQPTELPGVNYIGESVSRNTGPSRLFLEHPEYLVMDSTGHYPKDRRNMYMLCPAYQPAVDYMGSLTNKLINEYGFDGHKMDAYWEVFPCYNPLHKHAYPEESYEKFPEFNKIIYEVSKKLKPDCVIQLCNCGTMQDFYQSVYTDQPVVSDPITARQIRERMKVFKALWGPAAPIYGDHSEILLRKSEAINPDHFSYTFGTGGVPGTKFTVPGSPGRYQLDPETEIKYLKWMKLYEKYQLSKGEYLNLYDISFDSPETHAISKNGNLYYGLFEDKGPWKGKFIFKGLEKGEKYTVYDYYNEKNMGILENNKFEINLEFNKFLLLEVKELNF